jgi:hypothetical protein
MTIYSGELSDTLHDVAALEKTASEMGGGATSSSQAVTR